MGERDPWLTPWSEVPTTSRDDIASRFEETVADGSLELDAVLEAFARTPAAPFRGRYHVFLSAGRTGALSAFLYDKAMCRVYLACVRRRVPPWIRPARVALVGTSDPAHTLPRSAAAFGGATVRTIGLQDGLDHCLESLSAFDPDAIFGFSSAVALLAEAQLAGAISLAPEVVLVGTDTLTEDARAAVERAWGRRPLDVYATTEAGVVAFQCWEGDGLHVNEDVVRLEVESGRVVLTNLVNRVQPIVRYTIADEIRTLDEPCPCGLPFRRVELLGGRSVDVWHLPGRAGRRAVIHPIVVRSALDRAAGVTRSSAEQVDGRFVVSVAGPADLDDVRRRLVGALERAGADTNAFALSVERARE